ncbi:MAG: hypothetical protein ACHQHN_03755 [Sphingobacteriales bacterium]
MKKFLSVLIFSVFSAATLYGQTKAIGPAERKLTDSLCSCITRLDQNKIHGKKEATDAFMDCFAKQSDMLMAVTDEKKLSMEDNDAMHNLGLEIGKNLISEKCPGFMQLAIKMAQKDGASSESAEGKFKRIDTKGFNYIIVTGDDNQEKSFLWLEQFTGSENFMKNAAGLTGKKVQVSWKEIEVYLPESKGYYKVKEITAITIL